MSKKCLEFQNPIMAKKGQQDYEADKQKLKEFLTRYDNNIIHNKNLKPIKKDAQIFSFSVSQPLMNKGGRILSMPTS